jgi:type 1 glutamine amidotransferase
MRALRLVGCGLAVLILASFAAHGAARGAEPKRLLLLGQSPDGHPPGTHEYMAGLKILGKLLEGTPGLAVSLVKADEPWKEGPELINGCDGVVMFLSQGAKWCQADPRRMEALEKLAARGGGLSGLHWGIGSRDDADVPAYVRLMGGCHGGRDRKFKFLETDLRVADREHPIARGVADLRLRDEFYYQLKLVPSAERLVPLLKADIDGEAHTVSWCWERPDGGRTFGFSGLHFHDNWGREEYRRYVTQGVLWTLRREIPEKGVAVPIGEDALKLE